MAAWRRRHGDLAGFRLGPTSCHLVSHPDLAEEALLGKPDDFAKIYDPDRPTGLALVLGNGLLTSEGLLWKRNRRLIQPVFQRQRVVTMAQEMVQAGEALLRRWERFDERQPVDVAREMMKVTFDVITRTMFSASLLHEVEHLAPALDTLLRYAFRAFHNPFRVPLWIPTPGNRAFHEAKRAVDQLMGGLIHRRRESEARLNDLLDQLLYAVDPDTGTGLTDKQVQDELLTIAAAGHETTANALSWAWYLLATHRPARARLHDELAQVLGSRTPTVEDVPRLAYTRAVFEETLRLYPPAPALQRKAVRDTSLGGCPIKAGSLLIIALWNIHRHPDYWDEPDAFRPERFTGISDGARHRLAWMPFGAGHRACIGNHFAMIEGLLLLATIAQRYEMEVAAGYDVEPEVAVTVRPKNGLNMLVRRRHPTAAAAEQRQPRALA
jgi:cytochrome P450